jgi:hypothetical protein
MYQAEPRLVEPRPQVSRPDRTHRLEPVIEEIIRGNWSAVCVLGLRLMMMPRANNFLRFSIDPDVARPNSQGCLKGIRSKAGTVDDREEFRSKQPAVDGDHEHVIG